MAPKMIDGRQSGRSNLERIRRQQRSAAIGDDRSGGMGPSGY